MAAPAPPWLVLDIEGTLTPTAAVHDTLYGYARPRLGPWIDAHPDDPEVLAAVRAVRAEAGLGPDAGTAAVVAVLHTWMDADRKAPPLKTLQGLVWEHGYATGALCTDLFPDVPAALAAWRAVGLRLAVFSSGSVAGQRAAFSRTVAGDLRGLLDRHFDPGTAGPKREPAAYERIAAALDARPATLTFLSDVPAELDAAASAGWRTVGVRRPGEPYGTADFGRHPTVPTLGPAFGPTPHATVPPAVGAAGAALAAEAARYAALGWMRGTSGNLSVRLGDDPLRLAVTASGRDKGELGPGDAVVVDGTGAAVPGERGRPSAEAGLHARIAAATGAGAVVHVHLMPAVLAGERWPAGVPLSGLEMLKGLGLPADRPATVPVVPNAQDMTVLGDAFEATRRPGVPALIVARHGLYAWGADLAEARHRVECLDWLLRFALDRPDDLRDPDPRTQGEPR